MYVNICPFASDEPVHIPVRRANEPTTKMDVLKRRGETSEALQKKTLISLTINNICRFIRVSLAYNSKQIRRPQRRPVLPYYLLGELSITGNASGHLTSAFDLLLFQKSFTRCACTCGRIDQAAEGGEKKFPSLRSSHL